MITCGFLTDFVIVKKPSNYTVNEDNIGYYHYQMRRKKDREQAIVMDMVSHAVGIVWGTSIMIPALLLYDIHGRSVLFALAFWAMANAIIHSLTDNSRMFVTMITRLIQIIVTDILIVGMMNIWLVKG